MKGFSFNSTLIAVSVILAAQSNSWMSIWMLMEMNMVGMLLQLMGEMKKEKAILFIIFQTLPAMMLLTYLMSTSMAMESFMSPSIKVMVVISMMCKIGMFPLQNWVLKLSKSISWFNNFILMSWQKILPLMVLMKISWSMWLLMTAIMSMMVLSLILMNMMETKSFIMSSSLIHMSWMMVSMKAHLWIVMSYLMIYSMVLITITSKFKKKLKKMTVNQTHEPINTMKVSMLSLAGMPPLAGFIAKTMVLMALSYSMESKKFIMIMIMVATMSFFAYIQIIYKALMLMKSKQKSSKKSKTNKKSSTIWTNIGSASLYYA